MEQIEKKERKKESSNSVWLCRFCTRRLPICACLSPFLHVKPFSDVLFEYLLYLCKGHVTAIKLSVYYQMTHVMSVLSWTHQRAGSFEVLKVRGGERVQRESDDSSEKKWKIEERPDWTWQHLNSARLKNRGGNKVNLLTGFVSVFKSQHRLWWNLHKPFCLLRRWIPGQPTDHPPTSSCPPLVLSCLQTRGSWHGWYWFSQLWPCSDAACLCINFPRLKKKSKTA